MAAEEKNTLDKIIKAKHLNQENGFNLRLHFFPDISDMRLPGNGEGEEEENSFQRVYFKEFDSPFDVSEQHGGNGGSVDGKRESLGDIEEEADTESGNIRLEQVLNSLQGALSELEKVKKEVYSNAEKEAVELALAIARKIVCHEVNTSKTVVLSVVKEALKRVVDHKKVKIRVNPSDLNVIKEAKSQFSDFVDNTENITIEEDEAILNGGCVIETDLGEIDARIEKQFQTVEEAFDGLVKSP